MCNTSPICGGGARRFSGYKVPTIYDISLTFLIAFLMKVVIVQCQLSLFNQSIAEFFSSCLVSVKPLVLEPAISIGERLIYVRNIINTCIGERELGKIFPKHLKLLIFIKICDQRASE